MDIINYEYNFRDCQKTILPAWRNLAADESPSTMKARFDAVGIPEFS